MWPKMRETVWTMRVYLVLIGTLGSLNSLGEVLQSRRSLIVMVPAVSLALYLGLLYLGIRLKEMLRSSRQTVTRFFLASAVWLGFQVLLGLAGLDLRRIVGSVVGLIIIWYLSRNARRLSIEQQYPSGTSST